MKGDLTTQQDNAGFSIVRPKKMDVDNQGQQRTNVSVKSKCYRTAQRELIHGHTLCSQVLLLPRKKEKFPPPLNYFVFLFLYPPNPEFRNPQTTPSKKRWIFFLPRLFHPAIWCFNVQRLRRMEMIKPRCIPPRDLGALWQSRLNLKFDNPTDIIRTFICSSYMQRSV